MSTPRRYTAELRQAEANGHLIVCSIEPRAGWPVYYTPRFASDPEPWTLGETTDGLPLRLSGRECHSVKIPHQIIQRAETIPADCLCDWVRNTDYRTWDRLSRRARCPLHGLHDHWHDNCPADRNGPWIVFLCAEALLDRATRP